METPTEPARIDSEHARKLYRQRTRRLAERTDSRQPASARTRVLSCLLGGERYAIALESISSALPARRIESVPGAAPEVLGILSAQGEVVVVLSLPALLGLGAVQCKLEEGSVILLRKPGARVGLWVESLGGVESVDLGGEAAVSGTEPGAVRRRYLKPEAAPALSCIEAESIFEHAIFREGNEG